MDELVDADEVLNARDRGKKRHRRQLLDATSEAIYLYGVRGATIDKIHEISGLSRGMISLHFQSKENLLKAVAKDLADEYTQNWQESVIASHEGEPVERLNSLIAADLSPAVLNERNIAIWFSFRAEVNSHPEYRHYVNSRDSEFRVALLGIFRGLISDDPDRDAEAKLATNTLTALLEGMWTDFHLNPKNFDRDEAQRACLYVARSFFPDNFEPQPPLDIQ